MTRSLTYSALTLRVKSIGESNREAWFLSPREGIIRATVFGGPKSRLRSQVSPFHSGTLWLYHDPVKDSRKVSDFDVKSYRTGIREVYERAMAADVVAETILASHGGGGGWVTALMLAENVLDALETADPEACTRYGVYFFWRWSEILGIRPEISSCSSCACEAKRDGVLWYSGGREAVLCETCLQRAGLNCKPLPGLSAGKDGDHLIRIDPGARLWLKEAESLPAGAVARVSLDARSLEQAKALSQAVLAAALGKKLPTWEYI